MIKIAEPAVALNDHRVGGRIRMSQNLHIRQDDSRQNIIGAIATGAAGTQGGRLKSVVLNSHGVPGYLLMGEGFWRPHTEMFQKLNGLVDNIWMTACRIASRGGLTPGERLPPNLKGQIGDGYHFCRNIAMNARCNVIASMNDQDVPNRRIPDGCVDAYEGALLCFKADGEIAWAHHYALHNGE
jgi:hypothetical protein